jgi:hypothetical protein
MKLMPARTRRFAESLVAKYDLDCRGLVILTEAASGSYLYNPMIAIAAGADEVLTFCRTTRYGTTDEVRAAMLAAYGAIGLGSRYTWLDDLGPETIARADVVTNSGHLRPFDAAFVDAMKPTAALPLMWEPWELRAGEIDLAAARRRGIVVLGSNEHEPPCDLRYASFLTAMHLLMAHQASIHDDRILVIGEQYTLARAIVDGLVRLGVACRGLPPTAAPADAEAAARWATYVLVAEHADHRLLAGPGGLLETRWLAEAGVTGVGVIAGTVDRADLEAHGLSVFPERLAPPGFMSHLPSVLGPYPVMDLFAAGLKVGTVVARARLSGLPPREAARHALRHSPALDLLGDDAWT